MKHGRPVRNLAAAISAVAVLVPVAIQVDRWRIERRQMEAQATFEREVADCEAGGGRWWRGTCEKFAPGRERQPK